MEPTEAYLMNKMFQSISRPAHITLLGEQLGLRQRDGGTGLIQYLWRGWSNSPHSISTVEEGENATLR